MNKIRSYFYTFNIGVVFYFLLLSQALAETIYIYADKGTCDECVLETEKSLREELSQNYTIKKILAHEIIANDWQKDAALLVIPGGIATPYAEKLDGQGNKNIRNYIEQGGSFLGICAGGYYGGAFVEFARDTSLEVIKKRELSLFAGKVIGPALAPYRQDSEIGARAAKITWTDLAIPAKTHSSTLYYNGGGYFLNAILYSNTHVIATYDALKGHPAAIIEIIVGGGMAILSGVHFEYNSSKISDQSNDTIFSWETQRKALLKYVLTRLRLKLASNG